MLMCFVIDGCEYVCPKCKSGIPFYNDNEKVDVSLTEHAELANTARPTFEEMYRKREFVKASI